jgi:hypothetical protein
MLTVNGFRYLGLPEPQRSSQMDLLSETVSSSEAGVGDVDV